MNEFRARIGRVRMKNGGADVRVLEGARSDWQGEETPEATLLRSAREIAAEGPVAAFVIVTFGPDGRTCFNSRFTDESPITRSLMPTYVAELVRRYVIVQEEARARFDDMFQWVER